MTLSFGVDFKEFPEALALSTPVGKRSAKTLSVAPAALVHCDPASTPVTRATVTVPA